MAWWIWLLIGLLFLAIEFASATMRVGLFAVGAFVVAILIGVGVDLPLWAEILIFVSISILSLLFIRPLIVRRLTLDKDAVVDSMIGSEAVALDEISTGGTGKVDFRGSTWSARNIGETALTSGQRCRVAAVDGLVLHVHAS